MNSNLDLHNTVYTHTLLSLLWSYLFAFLPFIIYERFFMSRWTFLLRYQPNIDDNIFRNRMTQRKSNDFTWVFSNSKRVLLQVNDAFLRLASSFLLFCRLRCSSLRRPIREQLRRSEQFNNNRPILMGKLFFVRELVNAFLISHEIESVDDGCL